MNRTNSLTEPAETAATNNSVGMAGCSREDGPAPVDGDGVDADADVPNAVDGPQDEDEEEEEDGERGEGEEEKDQATPPSPQPNERHPKRKCCHAKRRKQLFTIQAVNSNGTTERVMGEGGCTFSFSCE